MSMSEAVKITADSQPDKLPNSTNALKQMVLTLLGQIDDLNGQLYYLKRQLFGRKSEKLDPNQRLLFEDMYEQVQEQLEKQKQDKEEKQGNGEKKGTGKRKNPNHNGRNALPKDLPREEIVIEPEEEDMNCPVCGEEKQQIGEEVTEKLDYKPASFFVKRIVRSKYACKPCEGNISIGTLPPMAIDKGIPAEGLIAHILTSKYCDHAPLSRLNTILKRHDVDIPVPTMCGWVGKAADLLKPLTIRSRDIILTSPKIHTDDTRIPIKHKGRAKNGFLWVYIDIHNNVVFDFTPSRSRQGPLEFLDDYGGYLQADAYSGYDELYRTTETTEVGCHSHARRKFEHALDNDPVRAARMLVFWNDLYEIERTAKEENYTPEQLLKTRQEKARPILVEMKTVLDEYRSKVLPQSPIGKAVTYSLNQWGALLRYTDNPILHIDNNLSERTLRMVAIGRKNWMFAGSNAGAERAAIIYSLVASCKLCEIDPFAYFRDVLQRISTHPASRIDELLPPNWTNPKKK